MNNHSRRRFLEASLASLATARFGSSVLAEQEDSPAGLPTRPLGKTGERVSISFELESGKKFTREAEVRVRGNDSGDDPHAHHDP